MTKRQKSVLEMMQITSSAPEFVWLPFVVMIALIVICGGIAIRFFKWE